MLVLKRAAGEKILVGANIEVILLKLHAHHSASIGIRAPLDIEILRGELVAGGVEEASLESDELEEEGIEEAAWSEQNPDDERGFLVLKRRIGEKIVFGSVTITFLGRKNNKANLGFEAPQDVRFLRSELLDSKEDSKPQASC